nr:immunoglobulin heavy chain junction region [Mus musculus]MBK4189896.1 immunoglobulin heavy chain junction region [Mus musculus]
CAYYYSSSYWYFDVW